MVSELADSKSARRVVHVHIDPVGGIAGDMFLGAALDAGLIDSESLTSSFRALGFSEIGIELSRETRQGISGTRVRFSGRGTQEDEKHRSFADIQALLDQSTLADTVRRRAHDLFRRLAEAEGQVHGVDPEEVHFHECGAVDSICDFVGAALVSEHVDSWSCGYVPLGSGELESRHGTLPVPAPATSLLLEGRRVLPRALHGELVTPTGATILAHLVPPDGGRATPPSGRLSRSGFGLGRRDFDGMPNVLRLLVIEVDEERDADALVDHVWRLTCLLDDMNPELLPIAEKRLFEHGALDVVREPVFMKKGRIGTRITALAPPGRKPELLDVLFGETTTLGVQVELVERLKLERRIEHVQLEFGEARVKVVRRAGRAVRVAPEYDDCAQISERTGRSVQEVYDAVRAEAKQRFLDASAGE